MPATHFLAVHNLRYILHSFKNRLSPVQYLIQI